MMSSDAFDRGEFDKLYAEASSNLEAGRKQVMRTIERAIRRMADPALVRTHLVEMRVKHADSLAAKAIKNGWSADEAFFMASDLVGARVVCENIEDVARVTELLREAFSATARNVVIQTHEGKPGSGYRATHVNGIADVPCGRLTTEAVPFEIQVRTLLEDAWGKLTHRDIYKGEAPASSHIHTLAEVLSRQLRAADELAQEIRSELSKQHSAPSARPDLRRITPDGVAYLFRATFGRNPAEWVLAAFATACEAAAIESLVEIEGVLADPAFRDAIRRAYFKITRGELDTERLFLQAPAAASRGVRAAVAAIRSTAKREVAEEQARWRNEVLGTIPDSVEALLSEIAYSAVDGGADGWIIAMATALGASHECGMCEATIVDPDVFEEAFYEHIKIEDLDGRVAGAIHNSGVEVGDFDQPSLCGHCAYVMARDD